MLLKHRTDLQLGDTVPWVPMIPKHAAPRGRVNDDGGWREGQPEPRAGSKAAGEEGVGCGWAYRSTGQAQAGGGAWMVARLSGVWERTGNASVKPGDWHRPSGKQRIGLETQGSAGHLDSGGGFARFG